MQARKLIETCTAHPDVRERIAASHPSLAAALQTGDAATVAAVLAELRQKASQEDERKMNLLQRLQRDEFDAEAQMLLEQMIHQKNIDEALAAAQEYLPESFGKVYMLYVSMEVNNQKVQAFVDSGAQVTIMSKPCADRCSLSRLIDRRFDGIAKGVGATQIVGRIHMTQIKIGSQFFSASFTVLDQDEPEILFGLDLLRKFHCSIDLKKNCLRIGDEDVPFLGEHEIKATPQPQPLNGPTSPATLISPGTLEPTASRRRAVADIEKSKVEQLTQLGFSEEQAKRALLQSRGNVDLAGAYLFQEYSNVP